MKEEEELEGGFIPEKFWSWVTGDVGERFRRVLMAGEVVG